MDERFKPYRKTQIAWMREWAPEDTENDAISVSAEDQKEFRNIYPGALKGKVATNPNNPADQWYVAHKFFTENYEEAKPEQANEVRS